MDGRARFWLIAAIGLGPMLSTLAALAFAPFLPLVALEMGTSVSLLGQIPAAMTLAAAGLGLVAGPLADHFGHRRLLLVGSAAVVGYGVGTAFASGYVALLAAGLLGALSRAIVNPVSLAVAATRFSGALQRRVLSIVMAGVSGSGILGVPLLTGVEALYGWRAAFLALAVAALAALALSAAALPRDSTGTNGSLRFGTVLSAYAPLLHHHGTLWLIVSSFLRVAGLWMMGTYISAFLVHEHGSSVQVAGLSFVAVGGGLFLGSLVAGGRRLSALPARPMVVATAPATGLLCGALFLLPVSTVAIMAIAFLAFVINGLGGVALNALILDETPAGRATTMTLNGSAQSLGGAVGSSIGGLLIALGGYAALGVGIPIFGIAASAVVWLARPAPAPVVRA